MPVDGIRVAGTSVRPSGVPGAGRGLFADERLAKGRKLGTMEGTRTSKDGLHVLWVFEDDETTYGLKVRNDLRFINHSRRPNVLFDGPDVYTLRVIRPGEELLAHYGHDWKDVD